MQPGEEEGNQFNHLYYQDAMGLGLEDIAGKGHGFGKGQGKGKGKGKLKLALEDGDPKEKEEPTEEEAHKEALKKARRARDQVASAQGDLEEALGKASSKLSSKGKAAAQGWSASLTKRLAADQGSVGWPNDLKNMLEEAAKVVKGARDESKELKQLANKEGSVASKKSRSSK